MNVLLKALIHLICAITTRRMVCYLGDIISLWDVHESSCAPFFFFASPNLPSLAGYIFVYIYHLPHRHHIFGFKSFPLHFVFIFPSRITSDKCDIQYCVLFIPFRHSACENSREISHYLIFNYIHNFLYHTQVMMK